MDILKKYASPNPDGSYWRHGRENASSVTSANRTPNKRITEITKFDDVSTLVKFTDIERFRLRRFVMAIPLQ
jgi:hypothetical protein